MEAQGRSRIDVIRTEAALRSGAQALAASCPDGRTMLADGRDTLGAQQDPRVRAVAEIVANALP